MNVWDYILAAVVAALIGTALYFAIGRSRKGGCCGECSSSACPCCEKKKGKTETE